LDLFGFSNEEHTMIEMPEATTIAGQMDETRAWTSLATRRDLSTATWSCPPT